MDWQGYLTGIGELYAGEVLGEGLAGSRRWQRWHSSRTHLLMQINLTLLNPGLLHARLRNYPRRR